MQKNVMPYEKLSHKAKYIGKSLFTGPRDA
jgi:hypothetical protein